MCDGKLSFLFDQNDDEVFFLSGCVIQEFSDGRPKLPAD